MGQALYWIYRVGDGSRIRLHSDDGQRRILHYRGSPAVSLEYLAEVSDILILSGGTIVQDSGHYPISTHALLDYVYPRAERRVLLTRSLLLAQSDRATLAEPTSRLAITYHLVLHASDVLGEVLSFL